MTWRKDRNGGENTSRRRHREPRKVLVGPVTGDPVHAGAARRRRYAIVTIGTIAIVLLVAEVLWLFFIAH